MAWPNQSNSNNNNTNNRDENTSSWEEQQNSKNGTEREMIYETFYSLAKTKLMEETQNRNGGLIEESPAYKEEVKHLNSILTSGVTQGLAGGLFVFASLRAAPYLLHRIRNQVHKPKTPKPKPFSNSSYQFDSSSSSKSSFSSMPKPPIFLRIIRLGLDITASAFFASAISELCADTDQMAKSAADIPLVAGRSAVSDVLCEDFVKVYTSIPKQTWDNYKGTSVEWDSLNTFCQNCIRRQTLEKELRQQTSSFHGSFQEEEEDGEDRHVEIPMPGVPKDLPIYIPWGDGSDAITVGKEIQEDDFMGPSFDFVEDDEGNFTTEFDTFDSHSGDKDERRKRP